jgi:hypothetical protein
MRHAFVVLAAFVVTCCAAARGEIVIDVGNHFFQPGETKTFPLYVTGGDEVQGVSLCLQIGDGGSDNGGVDSAPVFVAVDVIGPGTIFSSSNQGQADFSYPLFWDAEVVTDNVNSTPTVSAEGVLAYITIDATGTSAGQTFSLALTGTGIGLFGKPGIDANFAGIPATITNGLITIVPEPGSIGLLCGIFAVPFFAGIRRRFLASA